MPNLFHPELLLQHTFKCILLTMIISSNQAFAAALDEVKHFPEAGPGIKQIVILLPAKQQDERDFKVELIPLKWMQVDGINRYRLQATITAHPLKGWGYTYYKVTTNDTVLSTMMAAPDRAEDKKAPVQADSTFIPYNSRMPIVCYVPDGYQLHYRIWAAGPQQNAENKTPVALIDALANAWVEPVPGMENMYQGFVLHADGSAESINMQTLRYQSWSADASHLSLTARSVGNHSSSTHTLAYEYKLLPNNKLRLKLRDKTYIYHQR